MLFSSNYESLFQLLEKEGDFMGALQMYIKAGLPAKAARIAISHPDISSQTEVIEKIASQLVKGGLYERVQTRTNYIT